MKSKSCCPSAETPIPTRSLAVCSLKSVFSLSKSGNGGNSPLNVSINSKSPSLTSFRLIMETSNNAFDCCFDCCDSALGLVWILKVKGNYCDTIFLNYCEYHTNQMKKKTKK